MSINLRFIFACGGTGGHIYPGIAVAQQLRVMGCDVSFIGNRNSMESELIPKEGFSFHGIDARKIYRKLTLKNIVVPFKLLSSFFTAFSIIRRTQPNAVFCTGSYVSAPVALAAILSKTPLFMHESNSYPGLTIRWLAKYSDTVFTSFSKTAEYLDKVNTCLLGIPLLQTKKDFAKDTLISELSLDTQKPIILITGGSQGSRAINSAIADSLQSILDKGFQVIWQTGKSGYLDYHDKYSAKSGVYIFDFSPQLQYYYSLAWIAITRAGAMTIAELDEYKLPAILIPLPTSAENHQYLNAVEQQGKGRCILINQKELTPDNLLESIEQIHRNHNSFASHFENQPNTAAADIARAMTRNLTREDKHAG